MATVTRMKENIDHIFSLFDLRSFDRRPLQSNRLLITCIYYAICRLVYKSGLTLGEELVELVPHNSSRLSPSRRIRWYLVTIIPYVASSFLRTSPLAKLMQTILTDVWFSLSPSPGSTSLIEDMLKPARFRPVCVHPESGLNAPAWLFPAYGIITLISSFNEYISACRPRKNVPNEPLDTLPVDGLLCNSKNPPCAICMDPIQRSTATICGHVFCWDCIMDWCASGEEDDDGGVPCPNCRISCKVSDLVPLVHYAPSSSLKPFWKRTLLLDSHR